MGGLSLSSSLTLSLAPRFGGGGGGAVAPITQQSFNGATATYSTARQGGTYADGSPWALVGGTVTGFTPPYSAIGTATFSDQPGNGTLASGAIISGTSATARKVNGAEINSGNRSFATPATFAANGAGPTTQGFDGLGDRQGLTYIAGRNVDPAATGSPIDISAECTVVKGLSGSHTITTEPGGNGVQLKDYKQVMGKYVPFTFVTAAPASDAYRPGIARTSKVSLYKRSDVDLTVLPTGLSWPTGYGTLPDIAVITAKFADPYFLQYTQNSGSGRVLAPLGNGKAEYGRDIAHDVGKALLCLCMSDYSAAQKMALIDQLIPFALDVCARVEEGGIFPGTGGGEPWRKAVVVACARLLQNSPNYSYMAGYAANILAFAEDTQIATVADALIGMLPAVTVDSIATPGTGYTGGDVVTQTAVDVADPITFTVTSSAGAVTSVALLSQGSNWKSYTPRATTPTTGGIGTGLVLNLRARDRYAPFMRGQSEWIEDNIASAKPGANYDAIYRDNVGGPMIGIILAMRFINGAMTLWGKSATFEYYDRYWNNTKAFARGDGNNISVIAGAMRDTYDATRYAGVAPTRTVLKADTAFVWIETDQLLSEINLPATTDFAVTVGGSAATISYVRIFGKNIGLRLATPLTSSATAVTIAYTQGTVKARNIDGQFLASFAATSATNSTGVLPASATIAMCDNGATAYSTMNGLGSVANINRFLFAVKFKFDSIAAGAPIFYANNNNRLYAASGTQLRHTFQGSANFQQTTSGLTTGSHIWLQTIDFKATSLATLGVTYLSDNAGAYGSPGSAPATGSIAGTAKFNLNTVANGIYGILSDLAGVIADGGVEWILIDYGDDAAGFTLPDLTNSTVRAGFTTANLTNTNGQSVTTTGNAPKIFFPCNVPEMNDMSQGCINRGTALGKLLAPVVTPYT